MSTSGIKCGAGCATEVNEGINCTICNTAFHPKCAGMSVTVIRAVKLLAYFNWFCNACGEKYGDAAVKAAASDVSISDQLLELRELVVDCTAKVDAANEFGVRQQIKFSRNRNAKSKNPTLVGDRAATFDRRRNLIIAGSVEYDDDHDPDRFDREEIHDLCKVLDVEFDPKFKLSRIGQINQTRHRLMRLEFPSEKSPTRVGLLNKGKLLRGDLQYGCIFINPDLNHVQIERNKLLVAELNHRRSEGEDVIIKSVGSVRKVILRPH